MFEHTEDRLLKSGASWHGTAIGWKKTLGDQVTKMPILCDRFCSVKYVNQSSKETVILYSTYLPTSGNDDLFLETLETLNFDILQNKRSSDTLILAADTNVSEKSNKRRLNAFKNFKNVHQIMSIMNSSQLDHVYVYR